MITFPFKFHLLNGSFIVVTKLRNNNRHFNVLRQDGSTHTFTWVPENGKGKHCLANNEEVTYEENNILIKYWQIDFGE